MKPADRTKPGEPDSILAAKKEVLDEPFMLSMQMIIMGKKLHVKVHDYLVQEQQKDGKNFHITMAGFRLEIH